MIFEIRGVRFDNKGAQLMLCAAVEKLMEWDEKNIIAIRPKITSFRERALLGLHQLVFTDTNTPVLSSTINSLSEFLPLKVKSRYGLVTYSQIDVILDASGFVYSDQWGPEQSLLMAGLAKKFKKQGKKIILLPQAFGPFKNPDVRNAVIEIINHSDLVFARDTISHQHLIDLGTKTSHIKTAPDFTNLLKGAVPSYFNPNLERACIIPNVRMTDKTSVETKNNYSLFLGHCIELIFSKGLKPFILVHDTTDQELANRLNEKYGGSIEIIMENDPLYIKGILGQCRLVVSSRFHGLINALSQDIPCLASGWSHKYQMLLNDYGCPECLVSNINSKDEIEKKINLVTEEPARSNLLSRIKSANLIQKKLALGMWDEVHSLIES